MTFNVEEQARLEDAFKKSLPVMPILEPKREKIVIEQQWSFMQSLLLVISFTLYYFFAGLAVLFGKTIPSNYKLPTKRIIDRATLSVKDVVADKKKPKSKIVDYDNMPPSIDLFKN